MRAVIVLIVMCLASCSLFKHTTKAEVAELKETAKVVDERSLILKTALRETNTLTYNPDGSILQFQQVQEELAQSQALQVTAKEQALLKKEKVIKESLPLKGWLWLGGGLLVALGLIIYAKFESGFR